MVILFYFHDPLAQWICCVSIVEATVIQICTDGCSVLNFVHIVYAIYQNGIFTITRYKIALYMNCQALSTA
jgi:hypothetical protein